MLHKEKHQLFMGQILRDIYTDTALAPLLGLKGGTCAYFFYGLPRFSVDLDFDLLSELDTGRQTHIFHRVVDILQQYGGVKDSFMKRHTLFALLSYGKEDHNIKIEISTRTLVADYQTCFEMKDYLGISMFVSRKEYLFASKLSALALRRETAMRDIYDIYFFAKNNWDLRKDIVELQTNKRFSPYMTECITLVESINDNQILQGLGECIDEKEKIWVKRNLRKEVIFYLKNFQAILK
ncbi:MAG: nucleotidyl transferase AbiEii/AbiGii toxin family protein [Patescibacteria group bacterium]